MVKFGYVAVVGLPNAGKSTIINKIVGEKVAIVSKKPQTTRDNILGIKTTDEYQIVFIDTPGIHRSKNKLDTFMNKNVRTALAGADVIVYVVDAGKSNFAEELKGIEQLKQKNEECKLVVAINKTDCAKKENVFNLISTISSYGIEDIVPLSAKTGKNADELESVIVHLLDEYDDESAFEFEKDDYTDKSINFLAAEMVREQALNLLGEEIPHGVACVVSKFEQTDKCTFIDVDVVCERDSHKSIIIGKQGKMLKEIGSRARAQLEKIVDGKVMLTLWVRVKKDWRMKDNLLSEFGYKTVK